MIRKKDDDDDDAVIHEYVSRYSLILREFLCVICLSNTTITPSISNYYHLSRICIIVLEELEYKKQKKRR